MGLHRRPCAVEAGEVSVRLSDDPRPVGIALPELALIEDLLDEERVLDRVVAGERIARPPNAGRDAIKADLPGCEEEAG